MVQLFAKRFWGFDPVNWPIISYDGEADIVRAWARGLAPDPSLTVSEWADRYRMLSSRASSEAGKYRTDRTPYMRDIMDALSPSHPARRIVFMSGAQLGKTEAGNNWIGYCIHQAPGPFLAVQPTTELAKRLSCAQRARICGVRRANTLELVRIRGLSGC